MNELAELLGGLPPWAQLLGLLLLGGLAVGLRRRNSARSRSGGSRSGTPRSSRPRSSQQRSSAPAVLRSDRSDGSDPSAAHAQDPGRVPADGATRRRAI
ncbi:LPXTG cell wall anchor domain-containing protein [Leucobacter soli]|uniref:LPXTG cell wall anchor domain-containing protein n=1 Tax=Leucobacter soli TaxID=2812850 RepID=UPI00361762BB